MPERDHDSRELRQMGGAWRVDSDFLGEVTWDRRQRRPCNRKVSGRESTMHGSAFQEHPRMPDWCSGDLDDREMIRSLKQSKHAGFGICRLNIKRMAAETGACL